MRVVCILINILLAVLYILFYQFVKDMYINRTKVRTQTNIHKALFLYADPDNARPYHHIESK